MLQNILWLKPHDKLLFTAVAEGQRSIEHAAVVVYDESRKIVAIDSASFYTVAGQKEVTDRSFWDRLR
ncbi:hypothetical protein BF49_5902 [Bradyrhizobium sp.]|nr:hypothetical protein BF49_5894 [Bradyrhizobium sp.]CUT14822.1 hypothetical protein BF49_5902 [Bradyrhizobium sp.]